MTASLPTFQVPIHDGMLSCRLILTHISRSRPRRLLGSTIKIEFGIHLGTIDAPNHVGGGCQSR